MMVVVTYDVNTETAAGKKRLRKVSKKCLDYGQRVQNSVFECVVDQTSYITLKNSLSSIIDESTDSLRFYRLGDNYQGKIEHLGTKDVIDVTQPLVF